jgi:hypothetical protein
MKLRKTGFIPDEESQNRPDSFGTRDVWDSEVFRFSLVGSVVGAFLFAFLGFLLASGVVKIPWAHTLIDAGHWIVVLSLAAAGVLFCGFIGSLIGLYNRG